MELLRVDLTNFLSYREASLEFGEFVALVGANAAGKSNAVAALKLLGDIPKFGLQTAIARRGGFDQLRHRSEGRPYDPAIALHFRVEPSVPPSVYELKLASRAGKKYDVKLERAEVHTEAGSFSFKQERRKVILAGDSNSSRPWPVPQIPDDFEVAEGQSALPIALSFGALYGVWIALDSFQIVEANPTRLRELQDPSPVGKLEPDGANAASIFEALPRKRRKELVDELGAIVPGLVDIEPRHFSNKLTLVFKQRASGKTREFLASQMSDGTLRAFCIMLSLSQEVTLDLLIVEEPEVAIHLGALRTMVDILRAHAGETQIVLTTHSADIIDALQVDELRVVWTEGGASRLAPLARHTKENLRRGLITPGELLRADALDPAI